MAYIQIEKIQYVKPGATKRMHVYRDGWFR
jgi:hypothetical protein